MMETDLGSMDPDITIDVGGEELTCRKQVLVDNSDYFRAMFECDMVESRTKRVQLVGQVKLQCVSK